MSYEYAIYFIYMRMCTIIDYINATLYRFSSSAISRVFVQISNYMYTRFCNIQYSLCSIVHHSVLLHFIARFIFVCVLYSICIRCSVFVVCYLLPCMCSMLRNMYIINFLRNYPVWFCVRFFVACVLGVWDRFFVTRESCTIWAFFLLYNAYV